MKIFGIIIGLLILSLILIIHEAGHFFIGRKLGFKVVEFSIFMGPRLLSWERKGVRYSIKAIPLGASVEFAGEYSEEEGSDKNIEGNFFSQAIWKRALTMLAGPGFNLIAAFLAFILLFSINGFSSTKIDTISNNSLAYAAGMQAGETILELNDYKINTDFDLRISSTFIDPKENFTIKAKTPDGNIKTYNIEPKTEKTYKMGVQLSINEDKSLSIAKIDKDFNPDASKFVLGDKLIDIEGEKITSDNMQDLLYKYGEKGSVNVKLLRGSNTISLNIKLAESETLLPLGIELEKNNNALEIVPHSLKYMWSYTRGTGAILGRVITGNLPASDALTGPVGIVSTLGTVATQASVNIGIKLMNLLSLFASISLALGIANLIPIVPMDGGQLALLLIEKIRGKRLSVKAENIITIIGIVVFMLLFIFALGIDIGRIFK